MNLPSCQTKTEADQLPLWIRKSIDIPNKQTQSKSQQTLKLKIRKPSEQDIFLIL